MMKSLKKSLSLVSALLLMQPVFMQPAVKINSNLAPAALPALQQGAVLQVPLPQIHTVALPPEIHLIKDKIQIVTELPFEVNEEDEGYEGILRRSDTHFHFYRGHDWFDSFYRGHRIFYVRSERYLFEYRVVTSDIESILKGHRAFQTPDYQLSVSPSIELRVFELNNSRSSTFDSILAQLQEDEQYQDVSQQDPDRGNQYTLLENGSTINREDLPLPLQDIPFSEVRDLGHGILAFIEANKFNKNIYFYSQESGLALKMVYKEDRVVSMPLFKTDSEKMKLKYAQFVYNVLAKIHNFSARTPIVWDVVLSQFAGIAEGVEPIDLPNLVQLIHKKRNTVPPKMDTQEFITPVSQRVKRVAVMYDVYDRLSPTIVARMQESPNINPVMIIGTGKGLAPYALWRNLNHANYEQLYKDMEYAEIIDEELGTYGYLFLNGKQVWVFKNFEQLKGLIENDRLNEEAKKQIFGDKLKIDALVGGNFDIEVENLPNREEIEVTKEATALETVLGQEAGSIRTYSTVDLFRRNAPYRTVVDPKYNMRKLERHPSIRHFKSDDTSRRAAARLIKGMQESAPFTINGMRSIRLQAQMRMPEPLDKSARRGSLNSHIPFSGDEPGNLKSRFINYFNDFESPPKIDRATGGHTNDKTSSHMELVFELAAENDLKNEDVFHFLEELADGELKGYLHLYRSEIIGQHVRKQPGIHISLKNGIDVIPIPDHKDKGLYKLRLHVWYDADWERAGALWELVDSVGFRGERSAAMPEGTELEARRDKIRDFLFKRGTIPPARRVFPYVEFAEEPAVGVLQAPTGRIGRVSLYAMTQNVVTEETNKSDLPDYQVGNFNVRFVGIVGPSGIKDVVRPVDADGTYGKWNADIEFGKIEASDPEYDGVEIDFEELRAWFTINGSEPIYLIRGRDGKGKYLPVNKIAYDAMFPLIEISENQRNHFFLFSASGTLLDQANQATESGVIKKVLVPAPYKKIKSKDEAKKDDDDPTKRRLFIYHLSDVRAMWKMGRLFSPGSCTTNCGIFSIFMNEVQYDLPGLNKGGTSLLNKRVQRALRYKFDHFWDDFPAEWRKDQNKKVSFRLFEDGRAVTNHAKTNSMPEINAHTDSEAESKPGDVKKLDSDGMSLTGSGVKKAVDWVLPSAKKIETDSLRVQQATGSNFVLSQSVAAYNVRTDTPEDALKAYLKKKYIEAVTFAAEYLFQGSVRIAQPAELMNAHSTRRDPVTSIFDLVRLRFEMQLDEEAVRFRVHSTAWYDNEWGFTSQVLGLLSELALAMEEEDRDANGSDPIEWLPDSPEGTYLSGLALLGGASPADAAI